MIDNASRQAERSDHAKEVLRRLDATYGRRSWTIDPTRSPLDELIQTILSQHTSDLNSERAFRSLTERFAAWEEVAAASTEDVADAIRCGGLADQKARTILRVLARLLIDGKANPLGDLYSLPLGEAKARLGALPGVGPKTTACVLLFACGRPALPVDTHVYRVARRIGLIDAHVSPERAHDQLEQLLAPDDVYPFHVGMITHGQRICQARAPRCDICALVDCCDHGRHSCRATGALEVSP